MKNIYFILLFVVSAALVTSCGDDYQRDPGSAYAPDMWYSRAYDYYNNSDSLLRIGNEDGFQGFNKMPAKNSIAREQGLPTHVGELDTTAGYALTNPYQLLAKDLEQGKRLYLIHCGICHGEKLDGQGPLYTSEKYIAAPANLIGANYVNFTQGKIYHAIMYGKNMMGSYASQLDARQRWQVIAYIKSVQAENGGAAFTMISEEEQASADLTNIDAATSDVPQNEAGGAAAETADEKMTTQGKGKTEVKK